MSAIHSSRLRTDGSTWRSAAACSSRVRSRRTSGRAIAASSREMITSSASTPSARRWPVGAVHDPNRVPDAPRRGEARAPRSRVAVRGRSRPPVLFAESRRRRAECARAASVRAACAAASANTSSRSSVGTTPRAVRRIQRVECCEHDDAVGVAERRLDDRHAVLRRRGRGCMYQARAPRRSVARERGCEERDRRVAEPPERRGRAARGAGLLERSHDPTDDFPLVCVLRGHGVECCGSNRRDPRRRGALRSVLWSAVTIRRGPSADAAARRSTGSAERARSSRAQRRLRSRLDRPRHASWTRARTRTSGSA